MMFRLKLPVYSFIKTFKMNGIGVCFWLLKKYHSHFFGKKRLIEKKLLLLQAIDGHFTFDSFNWH